MYCRYFKQLVYHLAKQTESASEGIFRSRDFLVCRFFRAHLPRFRHLHPPSPAKLRERSMLKFFSESRDIIFP